MLNLKSILYGVFFSAAILTGSACSRTPQTFGSEAGNGGNAVVCRNGQNIESVRLLDFYEAKTLRDTHYSLGDASLSAAEKVKIAIERVRKFDTARADYYQNRIDHFLENAVFVPGVKLSDTKDYGYVPIPSNCAIEQLCIQKKPATPEEHLYTISLDLWDRLDEDHRAGLMLHEVVYGDALARGQKNSVPTRIFTGLITSKNLERISKGDYDDVIQKLSLGQFTSPTPIWLTSQLRACVNQPFVQDLRALSNSQTNGEFVFSIPALPKWLRLSGQGLLSGTPTSADVGKAQFKALVTDTSQNSNGVDFDLTVVNCSKTNFPGDLILYQALAGKPFRIDLSKMLTISGPAVFTMTDGPTWLRVTNQAILEGTPSDFDQGESRFTVHAQYNERGIDLPIGVLVKKTQGWSQDPIDLGTHSPGKSFTFDLQILLNAEDQRFSFSATGLPSWMKLSSNGVLSGTPGSNDVGSFSPTFTVSGDSFTASASGFGSVRAPTAPIFDSNPILLPAAMANNPYIESIANSVSPKDGGLTFSKIGGPSWLVIGIDGSIEGTAPPDGTGQNVFQVRVTDSAGYSTDASLVIQVKAGN